MCVLFFASFTPTPSYASLDTEAEVVAALISATATHEAELRVADQRIRAQRAKIEELRLQVALGEDEADAAVAVIKRELTEKSETYIAELEKRDRSYAAEIALFRKDVEDIASTPEGLAALKLFNDGDELGALAILDDLRAARDKAREARINIESAVEARRIATLALEARNKGKLTTADLIQRFEEIVKLDAGVHWDWVELGRLYTDAGDLTSSLEAATKALKTATTDRDKSVAYAGIGDVQAAQGNLSAALTSYQSGFEIIQQLVSSDPGNADWQRGLFVFYDKIGNVQVAQGNLSAALKSYQSSFEITQQLASSDPGNADWQRDLSISYDKIGDVQVAQGNLSAALKSYQSSFEIRQKLASSDPG
ncbi:MAG: hypothetical protein ABJN78_05040, partial [Hyphomicrobiales bacterium]